jgi:WhiB family redox-sensing transcriptional regulator
MAYIDDWALLARCRGGDPDALFVEGAAQHLAKRICFGCPVRYDCLAEALDGRISTGVWGGLTESERRALLKRYPQVPSWRRLFAAAGPQVRHRSASRGRERGAQVRG